jgi:hypothetical protein
VLGDIPRVFRYLRANDEVSGFFIECAKELGNPPVFQLILGPGRRFVFLQLSRAWNTGLRRLLQPDSNVQVIVNDLQGSLWSLCPLSKRRQGLRAYRRFLYTEAEDIWLRRPHDFDRTW